jgi:hypothetical protein
MSEQATGDRAETGPMRFGDDWCGVFIRGDNAAGFGLALGLVLDGKMSPAQDAIYRMQLRGLIDLLSGCSEWNHPNAQIMKPFGEAQDAQASTT